MYIKRILLQSSPHASLWTQRLFMFPAAHWFSEVSTLTRQKCMLWLPYFMQCIHLSLRAWGGSCSVQAMKRMFYCFKNADSLRCPCRKEMYNKWINKLELWAFFASNKDSWWSRDQLERTSQHKKGCLSLHPYTVQKSSVNIQILKKSHLPFDFPHTPIAFHIKC